MVDAVDAYHHGISDLFDRHAPIVTKKCQHPVCKLHITQFGGALLGFPPENLGKLGLATVEFDAKGEVIS